MSGRGEEGRQASEWPSGHSGGKWSVVSVRGVQRSNCAALWIKESFDVEEGEEGSRRTSSLSLTLKHARKDTWLHGALLLVH